MKSQKCLKLTLPSLDGPLLTSRHRRSTTAAKNDPISVQDKACFVRSYVLNAIWWSLRHWICFSKKEKIKKRGKKKQNLSKFHENHLCVHVTIFLVLIFYTLEGEYLIPKKIREPRWRLRWSDFGRQIITDLKLCRQWTHGIIIKQYIRRTESSTTLKDISCPTIMKK
jgi:hypothetical protein